MVIGLVGELGTEITALPSVTSHAPVPIRGRLAASVKSGTHREESFPADETVGSLSTWIAMVEELVGHTPLLVLHLSTSVPGLKLVTGLKADAAFIKMPLPDKKAQLPVPTTGELPLSSVDAELTQSVWLGPAIAESGKAST